KVAAVSQAAITMSGTDQYSIFMKNRSCPTALSPDEPPVFPLGTNRDLLALLRYRPAIQLTTPAKVKESAKSRAFVQSGNCKVSVTQGVPSKVVTVTAPIIKTERKPHPRQTIIIILPSIF